MFGDDGARAGAGAGAGAPAATRSGSATSSTRSSAGIRSATVAAQAGPRRGAGRRGRGPPRRSVEAAFGTTATVDVRLPVACERCEGSGCEPGTHPARCDVCGGAGEVRQVRRSILGQIVTAAPCAACGATGQPHPDAVSDVPRRRSRVDGVALDRRRGPARRRRRPAPAALGPRSGGAARRRARRPLRHGPRRAPTRASSARATTCCTCGPSRSPRRSLGTQLDVETLDGPEELDRPAGHPTGARLPAEGPRACPRCAAGAAATSSCDVDVEMPDAALGRRGRARCGRWPGSAARRSPRRRTRASSPGSGPRSSSAAVAAAPARRRRRRARLRRPARRPHHRRRRRRPSPATVRRVRAGETITAADGYGRWRVFTVATRRARAGRAPGGLAARATNRCCCPASRVAFALTKGEKPELVVQKLTELGADRVLLVRVGALGRAVGRRQGGGGGRPAAARRPRSRRAVAAGRGCRSSTARSGWRSSAELPGLVVADGRRRRRRRPSGAAREGEWVVASVPRADSPRTSCPRWARPPAWRSAPSSSAPRPRRSRRRAALHARRTFVHLPRDF